MLIVALLAAFEVSFFAKTALTDGITGVDRQRFVALFTLGDEVGVFERVLYKRIESLSRLSRFLDI